jgi:D-lyxose ketol-isomerase
MSGDPDQEYFSDGITEDIITDLSKVGGLLVIARNLWHRFYGELGEGTVFVGEVSQVNDDLTDNYFLETVGRFATIEEDEPKLFPLWNELASLLQG